MCPLVSLSLNGLCLHAGEESPKLHKEASSDPDLELLLHPTEHGEEEEEDLETPQQH